MTSTVVDGRRAVTSAVAVGGGTVTSDVAAGGGAVTSIVADGRGGVTSIVAVGGQTGFGCSVCCGRRTAPCRSVRRLCTPVPVVLVAHRPRTAGNASTAN